MEVIHRAYDQEPVKQTKKELYHEQQKLALRRKQYQDFLIAGKDPEVIKIEAKAKRVNPDFRPKFMK